MDNSNMNRTALNVVTNQPKRNNSKSIDPLAKIRPLMSKKPNLVQSLSQSTSIQITSGLKMLNTRIQSSDDLSYHPLVTISDNDDSDNEDLISPVQKLTRKELREELQMFKPTSHTLLENDDDDEELGELQFRTQQPQPFKRSNCCYQYLFSLKKTSCIIS